MSSFQSFRITRRSQEPALLYADDYLRIEQPEWLEPPDGGFFGWLIQNDKGLSLQTLSEYWSKYKSFCEDDGSLEVEIYVYRSRLDLPYTLVSSFGELSVGAVGQASRTEYVDISMENTSELSVAVDGLVAATWEGDVYDKYGTVIKPPVVKQSGGVLSWDGEVVGTLKRQFSEVRTVHILSISPRQGEDVDPEKPATAYSSTIRAFWGEGSVEEHEVELPDLSGNCSGVRSGSKGGDDDDGSDEKCVRRTVLADPCTKEEISSRDEQIGCPDS